jgi:hypothetical protein
MVQIVSVVPESESFPAVSQYALFEMDRK